MKRRDGEPPMCGDDGAVCCAVSKKGFLCTLPQGHQWPKHIAEISEGDVCARWNVNEKEARLRKVNELVRVIASTGRKFFANTSSVTLAAGGDRITQFEIDAKGRVWLVDRYLAKRIYTHYAGRWRGFSEGGTLKHLCEAFRDFICTGKPVPANAFGPWPEWVCNGDLWGYGAEMETVREAARNLGVIVLETAEATQ